jgi:hypothetical protein
VWEYLIWHLDVRSSLTQGEMNKLGQVRWELVAIRDNYCVFKRPAP